MSSALAFAAITAFLKNRLENGLVNRGAVASIGSDVIVSALPPDRITVGADERSQLNLFLYRITPNTGIRRADRHLETNSHPAAAPLALDLHYLVTAYGAQDLHIEILLGYAMALFQALPVLQRDVIQADLDALTSDEHGGHVSPALAQMKLAKQIEQITVSLQFLNSEDMTKLWSSLQARYRPSVAYKVSAVWIGATE